MVELDAATLRVIADNANYSAACTHSMTDRTSYDLDVLQVKEAEMEQTRQGQVRRAKEAERGLEDTKRRRIAKEDKVAQEKNELRGLAADALNRSLFSGGHDRAIREWRVVAAGGGVGGGPRLVERPRVLGRHAGAVFALGAGLADDEVLSGGSERAARVWRCRRDDDHDDDDDDSDDPARLDDGAPPQRSPPTPGRTSTCPSSKVPPTPCSGTTCSSGPKPSSASPQARSA